MRRVCVFCGSSPGGDPVFADQARKFGRIMVERGLGLVYGGGSVGIMGIIADTVLEAGGEVVGVIPHHLERREIGHRNLTEKHVVDTMHERKALMADKTDGFVMLPGGIGTLEEFFEVWTWAQLGIHRKPIGVFNVAGYYDGLLQFLDNCVEQRFLKDDQRGMALVSDDAADLLGRMAAYRPRAVEKWLDRTQT